MRRLFGNLGQDVGRQEEAPVATQPQLLINRGGRSATCAIPEGGATVGGSMDCDLCIVGLPTEPMVRLDLPSAGRGELLVLSKGLDFGGRSAAPGERFVLQNGSSFAAAGIGFEVRMPAPASPATAGPSAPRKLSLHVAFGLAALAAGVALLAPSLVDDGAASTKPIALEPMRPTLMPSSATGTPDGTVHQLRRQLTEAGVADRVSIASDADRITVRTTAAGADRRMVNAVLDNVRDKSRIPIVDASDDTAHLTALIASATSSPTVRLRLKEGRWVSVGEVVADGWRLDNVSGTVISLRRDEAVLRIDLASQGGLR